MHALTSTSAMLVYSVPNSSKTHQKGQFLQEREELLHQTK